MLPRPRTTLCASPRSQNALGHSQEPLCMESCRENAWEEHPDQAPAFTITRRSPQRGHIAWGTNDMVLDGQINDGTSDGNVKILSRACSVHVQTARAKLRQGCTFSIVVIPIILIHVISHHCYIALGTRLKTFAMTGQKDPPGWHVL